MFWSWSRSWGVVLLPCLLETSPSDKSATVNGSSTLSTLTPKKNQRCWATVVHLYNPNPLHCHIIRCCSSNKVSLHQRNADKQPHIYSQHEQLRTFAITCRYLRGMLIFLTPVLGLPVQVSMWVVRHFFLEMSWPWSRSRISLSCLHHCFKSFFFYIDLVEEPWQKLEYYETSCPLDSSSLKD